ncbi:alpha-glucosidase C-terminal domain-containing protein, partial [Desulfobacterota bacterium AH_259_B03_O07]|nr:alpha-glucosidase C-terminal domain-containing protein [Desulfobacterota bacterium AH_259_B03_O07]
SNKNSTTFKISSQFGSMIRKRINEKCFHPNASQKILKISTSFLSLIRTSVDGEETILAITNVTDKRQHFEFDTSGVGLQVRNWKDVLSGKSFKSDQGRLSFDMEPYEVLWLKSKTTK